MVTGVAGILANIVARIASNAITDELEKGKETGMDNDEIWELENGKITAIVRGGVRYVKEKTCKHEPFNAPMGEMVFQCSACNYFIYAPNYKYCPFCGARVVK